MEPVAGTDLHALIFPWLHPPAAAQERVTLIAGRARQIGAVFSVLTILWIAIDAVAMTWPRWGEIALGRVAVGAALACLAAFPGKVESMRSAYATLGALIVLSLAFFFYANNLLDGHAAEESLVTITAYYYLPFIVAAGLSIFPLTILESAVFGSLPVLAMTAGALIWPSLLGENSAIATIWRLMLIAGISALAGMSQLRFLLLLVSQATRDGLTGLLVRRVGQELLDQQFAYAKRNDRPFCVLFLDLDNFKSVNDSFGHEAGDGVLRTCAASLQRALRLQDILVRWGGEEFLVALPAADALQAEGFIKRIAGAGIGRRPDGKAMTASIGMAELKKDGAQTLADLLDLADRRMYAAKNAGRNRYVMSKTAVQWLDLGAAEPDIPANPPVAAA